MSAYRDKNGRWRFRKRIRLPNGEHDRVSGTPTRNTKRDAEVAERAAIDKAIQECLHPELARKNKEVPTLREFAPEYLRNFAEPNNKPATVSGKVSGLRTHLLRAFGDVRLHEISPRGVEKFKADGVAAGWRHQTINLPLKLLRHMLTVAKSWGIIDSVPKIKLLPKQSVKFDFLDTEEALQLTTASQGWCRAMVVTGLKAGLRVGEMRALQWDDIDFERGLLHVRQNAWHNLVGTPKSGKPRMIPMCRALTSELSNYRHDRSTYVFGEGPGKLLSYAKSKYHLHKVCRAADLRQIGWHVLRHTFASHLVMKGVPLKAVQELLGHATIDETMRYAHLSPAVLRTAVSVLDTEPETEETADSPSSTDESAEAEEEAEGGQEMAIDPFE